MGFNRERAARHQTDVPLADRTVLTELASFENESTGQCNPGQELLASRLGIKRVLVNRILGRLEKKYRKIRQIHTGRSSSYEFLFPVETSDVRNCGIRDVRTDEHLMSIQADTNKEENKERKETSKNKSCSCSCNIDTSKQVQVLDSFIPSFDDILLSLRTSDISVSNMRILRQRYDDVLNNGGKDSGGRRIRNFVQYFTAIAKSAPPDDDARIRMARECESEDEWVMEVIGRQRSATAT